MVMTVETVITVLKELHRQQTTNAAFPTAPVNQLVKMEVEMEVEMMRKKFG